MTKISRPPLAFVVPFETASVTDYYLFSPVKLSCNPHMQEIDRTHVEAAVVLSRIDFLFHFPCENFLDTSYRLATQLYHSLGMEN